MLQGSLQISGKIKWNHACKAPSLVFGGINAQKNVSSLPPFFFTKENCHFCALTPAPAPPWLCGALMTGYCFSCFFQTLFLQVSLLKEQNNFVFSFKPSPGPFHPPSPSVPEVLPSHTSPWTGIADEAVLFAPTSSFSREPPLWISSVTCS